ncbi:MAG: trypsin-like peptidase domain-containing protein, partial [Acidimicrobiia bacterium]
MPESDEALPPSPAPGADDAPSVPEPPPLPLPPADFEYFRAPAEEPAPSCASATAPPPPPLPQQPLYGAAPTPPAPPAPPARRGGNQQRTLSIVAIIFLLIASAFVGFGARNGWFTRSSSTASTTFTPTQPSADPSNSPANDSSSVNGSGSADLDANAVSETVDPAIVNISTQTSQGEAAGTGLLISSKGLVLTNHHVISGAEEVQVEVGGNGKTYDAHVVGYAIDDDVALVQIEDVSGLPTVKTSSDVLANDSVLVIGNALGRGGDPTVSPGTVEALGQQITATDETGSSAETLTDMIQISASVQPGQSGGAVVNADGEVVGMTTAASTGGGYRFGGSQSANEAFAIPIARALSVAKEIQGGESTDSVHVGPRAILGVEVQGQLGGR